MPGRNRPKVIKKRITKDSVDIELPPLALSLEHNINILSHHHASEVSKIKDNFSFDRIRVLFENTKGGKSLLDKRGIPVPIKSVIKKFPGLIHLITLEYALHYNPEALNFETIDELQNTIKKHFPTNYEKYLKEEKQIWIKHNISIGVAEDIMRTKLAIMKRFSDLILKL